MTFWPFVRKKEATVEVEDRIVQMGIVASRGHLMLCHPDSDFSGATVKLVSVPESLVARELAASRQFTMMQYELSKYPTSLRPRRRKSQKQQPIPEVSETP